MFVMVQSRRLEMVENMNDEKVTETLKRTWAQSGDVTLNLDQHLKAKKDTTDNILDPQSGRKKETNTYQNHLQ